MINRDNIERLFKLHYSRLFSLAFSILKDESIARDIVQDVFAQLLSSDDGNTIGEGYLIKSVKNRCINHLHTTSVREKIERLIKINTEPYDDDTLITEREEHLSIIRDIIHSKLPPQCSLTMRLRFEKGLSYEEIAEEMQISKVAVYKHLRNGLEYIRKNLESIH